MGRSILKTRNMNQTAVQAYYKTNVSKLSSRDVVALKMQYIVALQMANASCREIRSVVRGREKEKLGIEIMARDKKLKAIGIHATKLGKPQVWNESEERIEMRVALVQQFASMLAGFNDNEETIDFFSDKLDLLKLEAQNKQYGKDKRK